MSKIIILTGLIRSGKTTALKQWISKKQGVYGVLTPDINEVRTFLHYPDLEQFDMVCESGAEDALRIGKFYFHKSSFDTINSLLISDFENIHCNWLIIDEIGPLELGGQGFAESTEYILKNSNKKNMTIILIVREKLVEQVIAFYKLNDVRILEKEELEKL